MDRMKSELTLRTAICSTKQCSWMNGLKKSSSGLYYSGIVDDVELVLEEHRKETVTIYGTRNSSGVDKENHEVGLVVMCS